MNMQKQHARINSSGYYESSLVSHRTREAIITFNRRIKKFEVALRDMPKEYTIEHYTGRSHYTAKRGAQQHTIDNYEAFKKYYQDQRRFLVNSIALYKSIIENFEIINKEVKKMPKSVRTRAKEQMQEQVLRKFNVQLEELYLTSGEKVIL